MKRTYLAVVPLMLVMVLIAALPVVAAEQAAPTALPGFTWHKDITVGAEALSGDNHSSKFNEYRDIPSGLFLESLNIIGEHPNGGYLELHVGDLGQRDEEALITGGQLGRYSLFLSYDKIPHRLSNDSVLIFQRQQPDIFTLPTAVRNALIGLADTDLETTGLQTDNAGINALINGLTRPFPVGTERSTWAIGGSHDEGKPTSYHLSYSDEHRTGTKPIGTALQSSPRDSIELPEPVDYHTRDVDAGLEYRTEHGAVQVGYWGQFFNNEFDALIWDNPFNTVDSTTAAISGSSARGRLALPPDNSSHTLGLSGVYNFSPRNRLVGSLSGATWRQNQGLLPATINSALETAPLPETSANLRIDTVLGNLAFTSTLTDKLSLNAGWRRYRMKDKRPSAEFEQVPSDQTVSEAVNSDEFPSDFTTNNLNADLQYAAARDLGLSLGWERETWSRKHRNVGRTTENTVKLGANYLPGSTVALRAYYRMRDKSIGPYVNDESEISLQRKYDEAARDRREAGLVLSFTPSESWQADLSINSTQNFYDESTIGMLTDNGSDISLDLAYAVSPLTSAYLGASRERSHSHQRSRYRAPGTGDGDPLNDWDSFERDHNMTYWAGVSHTFQPGWDGDLTASLTDGKGQVTVIPVAGGLAQGDGPSWPETTFKFWTLQAQVSRRVSADSRVRFGYRYERYKENDFALDVMQPNMGLNIPTGATVTDSPFSVYLAARQPSYTAHVLSVAVETSF